MVLDLDDLFQKKGYSEKEFRLDMAITLYQRKVASLSRSAKLAGLSKDNFEQILSQKGLVTLQNNLTANEKMLKFLTPNDPLKGFIKPIREHATIEELIKEQNYKGTDWDKLNAIAREMAIEEPLELLLTQLKD